jgi:C-8 sterol isomerase
MSYVFEPAILQQVAQDALAKSLPVPELISAVVQDLFRRYPRHIHEFPQWCFNNAGGAMGSIGILHASLTEYVIIFGTPLGTEGHSGRFFVDDYFIILAGEQWACSAGKFEREVYRPGEMHHLAAQQAKQYRIPDYCWALEYARGPIPTMLPFGFADTFSSTLDFRSLFSTVWIYTRSAVGELFQGKV